MHVEQIKHTTTFCFKCLRNTEAKKKKKKKRRRNQDETKGEKNNQVKLHVIIPPKHWSDRMPEIGLSKKIFYRWLHYQRFLTVIPNP